MKTLGFPLVLTVTTLALVAIAPAQRGGGGGGRGGGGGGMSHGGGGGGTSRGGGMSRGGGSSRGSWGGGSSRPSRSDSGPGRSYGGSSPFSRSVGGDRSFGSRDSWQGSRSSGYGRSFGSGGYGRSYGNDRSSRAGGVYYGSHYDGYGRANPTRYGSGYNHSTLGIQINRNRTYYGRGDHGYGGVYGGLRFGFVGYGGFYGGGFYGDGFFGYPYYAFDPWAAGAVVASPWYAYSYLPPYIDQSHVVIVDHYDSSYRADDWQSYDYRQNEEGGQNELLNDSLDDIRDAFGRNSVRYGERLIPQSGQVAIFNDGKYDYSLNASDFKDMFLDGIEKSQTISYDIVETRTRGDEVHVRARHEYKDSWGKTQTIFHTYTLRREEGDHYVIREFGSE